MKIKLIDKLLLNICALLVVLAGIAMILIYGCLIGYPAGQATPGTGARLIAVLIGAVSILCGAYMFMFCAKYRYNNKAFVVMHNENGDMRIAVKAIESQVKKCVDMHDEMHLNDISVVNNSREGVTVDIKIALAGNISIPLAVAALQKQVKQYLVASSGIEVKDVRVSVDTTKGEVGEASPYQVDQNTAETQVTEAEKTDDVQDEKKLPLHQRLFRTKENKPEAEAVKEAEEQVVESVQAEAEEAIDALQDGMEDKINE